MNAEEKRQLEEVLNNCECPPLHLKVHQEKTPLQQTILKLAVGAGVPEAVMHASDHDFYCRCDACKQWWRAVGPEDDGTFGPFTREEIRGNV